MNESNNLDRHSNISETRKKETIIRLLLSTSSAVKFSRNARSNFVESQYSTRKITITCTTKPFLIITYHYICDNRLKTTSNGCISRSKSSREVSLNLKRYSYGAK